MTVLTHLLPNVGQTVRSRLLLLMGQAFALGLTLAFLLVIGNALFLSEFGAAALPYTYITVAITGSLLSYGFTTLQNRFTLPQLMIATLTGLALFYVGCWLGLTIIPVPGVSFALVVTFALLLQLGFVFLGGQAGRLFDVRQIRQLFSLVVSGFVVGFIVGALIVPPLVDGLGGTAQASVGLVGTTVLWLILLIVTNSRFGKELSQGQSRGRSNTPSPQSLPKLLQNRFIRFIFVYQMLAVMVYQLTDFIMLAQVAERYQTSESSAQFFSRFTAILNGTDLLFTTLLSGYFLSRFGLNVGLLTNPIGVGMVLLAMTLSYFVLGPTHTLFFTLAVVARIAYITLTDGTTRAATNTTYQALPAQDRVRVQTSVEGIGGPVALGITGLLLLLYNALGGLNIGHITLFTLLIAVLWAGAGLVVYRDYAQTLLRALRRRVLDEGDLSLQDSSSLTVVERLLKSERLSDVRLALDVLTEANHPSLEKHLVRLLTHPDEAAQVETLRRLENRQTPIATAMLEARWLAAASPVVKGAALRTLCAYQGAESVDWVAPFMDDAAPDIRHNALVGLLRYGGISGVLLAGERLMTLTHSPVVEERLQAAQVIRDVAQAYFYQPLLTLLVDEDLNVRREALVAAAQAPHPRLLPLIVDNLAYATIRSAAATALTGYGTAILPLLEPALRGTKKMEHRQIIRLIRVCGQHKGEPVIHLLKQYINHSDREIRGQILAVLNSCGYRAAAADLTPITQAIQREVGYANRMLAIRQEVGADEPFVPLQRALDEEWRQSRQHLFYLLSFLYDSVAMLRAGEQLARGTETEKALALELLDVTLTPEQKGMVFPLVRPHLMLEQRRQQLAQRFPLPSQSSTDWLRELINGNPETPVMPWTQACAVYAAAQANLTSLTGAIQYAPPTSDPIVKETTAWALARLTAS